MTATDEVQRAKRKEVMSKILKWSMKYREKHGRHPIEVRLRPDVISVLAVNCRGVVYGMRVVAAE